jgi:small subunit ribosomal protein S11
MGKKRIVKKGGSGADAGLQARALSRMPRRKMEHGMLYIKATYNNTQVLLTDTNGNAVVSSSSGALGFKGAKKSTPFAAAKVGELVGEKALSVGVKEVDVIIRGVGSGRESAMRSFAGKGITVRTIVDDTPIPWNGPREKKPRRV